MAEITTGDNPYVLANPAVQMWEWLDGKLTLLSMRDLIAEARERFEQLSEADEPSNLAHHVSGLAGAEPASDKFKTHSSALVPHIEKLAQGKATRLAKKALKGGREDPTHHAMGALFTAATKGSKVTHIHDIAKTLHDKHLSGGESADPTNLHKHFTSAVRSRLSRVAGWEVEKQARDAKHHGALPTVTGSDGAKGQSADVGHIGRVGTRATEKGGKAFHERNPEYKKDKEMHRDLRRAWKDPKGHGVKHDDQEVKGDHYAVGEKKYGLARAQVDRVLAHGKPEPEIRAGATKPALSRLKAQGAGAKAANDELSAKRKTKVRDAAASLPGSASRKAIARELAHNDSEADQDSLAKRLGVSKGEVSKTKKALAAHTEKHSEKLSPNYEPPVAKRRAVPGPKHPPKTPIPAFAKKQAAAKPDAGHKDTPEQKREREQAQAAGAKTHKFLSTKSREEKRAEAKKNTNTYPHGTLPKHPKRLDKKASKAEKKERQLLNRRLIAYDGGLDDNEIKKQKKADAADFKKNRKIIHKGSGAVREIPKGTGEAKPKFDKKAEESLAVRCGLMESKRVSLAERVLR